MKHCLSSSSAFFAQLLWTIQIPGLRGLAKKASTGPSVNYAKHDTCNYTNTYMLCTHGNHPLA